MFCHLKPIVSLGENLYEMSNRTFWENILKFCQLKILPNMLSINMMLEAGLMYTLGVASSASYCHGLLVKETNTSLCVYKWCLRDICRYM